MVNYPKRFNSRDFRLSTLVLDVMLEMDAHINELDDGTEYEKATGVLSDFFENLSIEEHPDSLVMVVDLAQEFYWPGKSLKRKTIDDFGLHSHLFAKELENYRDASEKRQKELMGYLGELHRIVLPYGHERMSLAA